MLQVDDFVRAKLYKNPDAVIQDALRHLLRARPDMRVEIAVYRYENEDLSLAKAAQLAGVSWAQMRDILLEKGVQLRLGSDNEDEVQSDINQLQQHLSQRS